MDGIVNFSYRPLQLVMVCGLAVGVLTMLAATAVAIQYITNSTIWGYNPRQVPGWTSLIFVLSLLSGVQLISLGIIGEYIGRLFEEVKGRPAFIVKEKVNFEEREAAAHLAAEESVR